MVGLEEGGVEVVEALGSSDGCHVEHKEHVRAEEEGCVGECARTAAGDKHDGFGLDVAIRFLVKGFDEVGNRKEIHRPKVVAKGVIREAVGCKHGAEASVLRHSVILREIDSTGFCVHRDVEHVVAG